MTITLENILYEFKGFFVSDLVFYSMLSNLNGNEFKILIFLIKKTSKINQNLDGISINEIFNFTNISKSDIEISIVNLIKFELVRKYFCDKSNSFLYKIKSNVTDLKFLKNLNETQKSLTSPVQSEIKNFEGGITEIDMFSKFKFKK